MGTKGDAGVRQCPITPRYDRHIRCGLRRRDRGDQVRRTVESIERLQANLARFLDALVGLLEARETRSVVIGLDEVAFSAEIGADGDLSCWERAWECLRRRPSR
jgi:hypothetical protein